MSVTQAQLARKLGLSPIAVSYALRGSSKISAKTRQRVLTAARQLGYRANSVARTTHTGRFGALALMMGSGPFISHLPQQLLAGIDQATAAADYHLIVTRLPSDALSRTAFVPKVLTEQAADALLINYTHRVPPALRRLITRSGLPAVWINRKQPHDCVHPDDHAAALQATRHLLALRHRRIAYLDDSVATADLPDAHYSTIDRQAGYEQAMREAGHRPLVLRAARSGDGEALVERLVQSLDRRDRPTALIAYGSKSLPAVCVALARRGQSAPADLSIVTFTENAYESHGFPSAAMVVPNLHVGQAAVAMARQMLDGQRKLPAVALPFELLRPEALAPPNS